MVEKVLTSEIGLFVIDPIIAAFITGVIVWKQRDSLTLGIFLFPFVWIGVCLFGIGFTHSVSLGLQEWFATVGRWIDAVSLPVDTTGIVFNTTAFWPYFLPTMIAIFTIALGVVYWDDRQCRNR